METEDVANFQFFMEMNRRRFYFDAL